MCPLGCYQYTIGLMTTYALVCMMLMYLYKHLLIHMEIKIYNVIYNNIQKYIVSNYCKIFATFRNKIRG